MTTPTQRMVTHGKDGPVYTGFPEMSVEEWRAEAVRRFGSDPRQWRFQCPICKGTQSIADFEALANRPKHPGDVVFVSCIGRWLTPEAPPAFGRKKDPKPTPETHCNYTLGGLFCAASAIVRGKDGHPSPVFDFADAFSISKTAG